MAADGGFTTRFVFILPLFSVRLHAKLFFLFCREMSPCFSRFLRLACLPTFKKITNKCVYGLTAARLKCNCDTVRCTPVKDDNRAFSLTKPETLGYRDLTELL